jgi:hypothetical protein
MLLAPCVGALRAQTCHACVVDDLLCFRLNATLSGRRARKEWGSHHLDWALRLLRC